MRGSPNGYISAIPVSGIIPAHAGLTPDALVLIPAVRDHPRACGAHINVTLRSDAAEGSSPRMRGSPVMVLCMQLLTGIIPAHAGLTPGAICYACAPWDHPRACGAHLMSNKQKKVVKGSSPRMRGSLTVVVAAAYDEGIIPAHAGLTKSATSFCVIPRDHPRACGAHRNWGGARCRVSGSSPRMRGSLFGLPVSCITLGIIPAHAGLTAA